MTTTDGAEVDSRNSVPGEDNTAEKVTIYVHVSDGSDVYSALMRDGLTVATFEEDVMAGYANRGQRAKVYKIVIERGSDV